MLQDDERIERIVGIARRPFDPAEHGWTKMTYVRGDVRKPETLEEAFAGVNVVVHLAFLITGGNAPREKIRAINVEGTMNTFRAAAAAGAKRFVYASSVAAYGFHRDNPVGMDEDWPARPAAHLFYAQEKAEIEGLLEQEDAAAADIDLYLLRPPVVLGPHAVGAKELAPAPVESLGKRVAAVLGRLPIPLPAPTPKLPMQFIHENDVATAFRQCIVAAGPPGTYNISGDGVLTADDVARELGLLPLPVPKRPVQAAARAVASLPFAPPAAEWAEAASHPAIMDIAKAKRELGWEPRYSGLEALRETLRG